MRSVSDKDCMSDRIKVWQVEAWEYQVADIRKEVHMHRSIIWKQAIK